MFVTFLDIHLDGWPLHFWPKWVTNIIKLSMQIYSFWQNSRPQSPKTALFWAIIQIERAPFVSFYSISTQDKASFGQSGIKRDVFVHTATLQHSKGMLLKQYNLQRALFVFTALSLHLKGRHWKLSSICYHSNTLFSCVLLVIIYHLSQWLQGLYYQLVGLHTYIQNFI